MKMAVFWVVAMTRCPYDGGSKHLWNVGKLLPDYTAQQARTQPSSIYLKLRCALFSHHENVCGSGGMVPRILNLNIRLRCVISFMLRFPYPPGETHGIKRIASWIGSIAALDMIAKRKIPIPARNRSLAVKTLTSRITDWAVPVYNNRHF
jgi:hypothetical protein